MMIIFKIILITIEHNNIINIIIIVRITIIYEIKRFNYDNIIEIKIIIIKLNIIFTIHEHLSNIIIKNIYNFYSFIVHILFMINIYMKQ